MDKDTLTVIEHVLLIVSELLPFIPIIGGNGVVQTIVKVVQGVVTKTLDDEK